MSEVKGEPVNEKQTAGQIERQEETTNPNEAPIEVIEAVLVQQDDQNFVDYKPHRSYIRHQKARRVKKKRIDDKTRELKQDIKDLQSSRLETEFIAKDIFSLGTGISDDEIRRIMEICVSTKAMDDPERRITAGEKVIKRLKEALAAMAKGKNEYVKRSVQAEKACIDRWASALEIAKMMDEDRDYYKAKVEQVVKDNIIWKDNTKDTMRELVLVNDKIQYLRNEIEGLKLTLTDAQNNATNATVECELQKRSNQEIDKEYKKVSEGLKKELREYKNEVEKLEQELAMAQTQFPQGKHKQNKLCRNNRKFWKRRERMM